MTDKSLDEIFEVAIERRQKIQDMAKAEYEEEGRIEIDTPAVLSEGDDNGCYVQAWVWVDFTDTELDKEKS